MKKEKITIIFLVVSLMTALVLIALLALKKPDISGSEKKADTGPTVKTTADAATTSDAETTSDTEKTTDNEKETTTETPTTAEEETPENPDMLRDNKYNQIAINAKENGQKIVYLTFDDGSGTLTPAVLDTLDKYEEFCERYVLENRDAEILKDVGAFGEGSLRFKSALRNIGIIQSLGYTVHFIAQSTHSKDFDTKKESDALKLNKNTFSYCREAAYLVGYMYREKDERFITFRKTEKYPDLKDTFGLPDKINVKDLEKAWTKGC